MELSNLTEKEREVLAYLNNQKGFSWKKKSRDIAKKFELSDMHAEEMLKRFKEAGLIKKEKNNNHWIVQAALEVLGEFLP